MPSSRTIMVAGAGIGGLTAALAIAQGGFRVAIYEQAERLEETGAGIQLSPNASGILIALGLGEALRRYVVAPEELRIMSLRSGRVLARAPLGTTAEQRYGAPYWVIHRGDLQAVLVDAVAAHPDIRLHLGRQIDDFESHRNGVTIAGTAANHPIEERGLALVGADGIWSRLRRRLGDARPPRFTGHTAWRALAPADDAPHEARTTAVNLWLGRDAHFVHYPVKGGRLINVVAIARNTWSGTGWNAAGERREILDRFGSGELPEAVLNLLAAPRHWQKLGALRPPAAAAVGRGPGNAAGRRRPPDAALSGAGRRHGH